MKHIFLLLVFLPAWSLAGSFSLFEDTMDLGVASYRFLKFRVTPDQADSVRVFGRFETIPPDTPVELILLSHWNYQNGWQNRGDIDTLGLYRGNSAEIALEIPDFGDYVLIVSNRGNYHPVRFIGGLRVYFRGTGVTYDSLPMGMTILITVFTTGLVIAATIITVRKLRR